MPVSHRKFGDLLEEGVKRVHITRKKPIGYILDEFGYELRPEDSSKGRHALGHWYYKKRIPASMEDVAKLAKLVVTNSDVERDWLKAFLDSAGFPEADKLCDQYFVPEPTNIQIAAQAQPLEHELKTEIPSQDRQKEVPVQRARSRMSYLFGFVMILGVGVTLFLGLKASFGREAADTSQTQISFSPLINPEVTATILVATDTPVATVVSQVSSPTSIPVLDGKCPVVKSAPSFVYASPQSFRDFLNEGGSFTILQSGFNSLIQNKNSLQDGRISNIDLTGDGAPEVIISAILKNGSVWQILGCNSGQYVNQVDINTTDARYLRFVVDLNGDKLPEIVGYDQHQIGSTPVFDFFAQAWNGREFVDVINPDRFEEIGKRLPADITDWQRTIANATVTTRDVNGDGLFELVITGGLITPVPNCETRFERQFTETWAWNGKTFQLAERVYILPIYRFQRSADGDLAFALKQFDLALQAYQDVLFDANLFARNQYLSQLEYCKGIASGLNDTTPENEQALLEAYARWRILLVNTINGSEDAVKIVYQNLQDKFPEERPGHAYAVIATAFWEEYQATKNIETACQVANATSKTQTLYPSHTSENICFVP